MPHHDRTYDFIIVGGGIVGASFACALGDFARRHSLRIGMIDSHRFDATSIPLCQTGEAFDPRVSAITAASQQFLGDIGVWQDITAARVSPYTDMHVWDADGTGSIHFSAVDINETELGHIIENSVILAALYTRLEQLGHVELIAPATVATLERSEADQRVVIGLEDGRELSSTLLVAADGPASRTRKLAGIRTREWDYDQSAIVTTVRSATPHRATALQRFMATGPLAFLPLSGGDADGFVSSIVWSVETEKARQLMALNDEAFRGELALAMERRRDDIQWVDRRHCFPLRQRHAVDYVQGRVVLIGDAAHSIHPLAGQGANLGLSDARVLAAEVALVLNRGRPLSDPHLLRRYQRKRIGQNLGMMWLMEGFKGLFAADALPLRWLRNAGLRGMDRSGPLKHHVMRKAMGLDRRS
ncbi:MAG: UbiH/UbiF/VisC/COQ6 family ubiquinone biosynthesis hydroxylase [Pseudohongiellaceae bacterium]